MGERAWTGPLEKVDDYRWRIPQSYSQGMRVPGLVFADEKLIADIKEDRSLEQVANVAHLPGIVKASMAMPDLHWGYGFPIGGVAAMDPDTGVISPGGIGYDINCLSGDTEVLHGLGYRRPLAQVVTEQLRDPVRCYGLSGFEPAVTPIVAGVAKQPTAKVLEVETTNGHRAVATADHPFLTPGGMRSLGALTVGDRVAVNSFEGVPYEPPGEGILIEEGDVAAFLHKRGKGDGNTVPQVLNDLKRRGLLPLRRNSPALPILLKVLGFVLGDGTLLFNSRKKGVVAFFGQPATLDCIQRDLSPWFTVSRLYSRLRSHLIETEYGSVRFQSMSYEVRVRSTGLAVLLALLGCPVGNKARQDYEVPRWLRSAPLWHKRLFLATYFDAELQTPRAYLKRNRNAPCPLLTLQKQERYVASGKRFLKQIADLAREFGVVTLGIEEHRERIARKHGTSHRLRLSFSSRPGSLIALYSRIGFEYEQRRRVEASVMVAYQHYKKAVWEERRGLIRKTLALRALGLGAKKIFQALGSQAGRINLRFVERTIYGRPNRTVRVGDAFLPYLTFRRMAVEGLGESGLVWEAIGRIRPRDDIEQVYDITVAHGDHNFVANSFVVHNCGVRLVKTDLVVDEVKPVLKTLIASLFNTVPCGVGMSGEVRLGKPDAERVMTQGSRWTIGRGYGVTADLAHTESEGCLEGADPAQVSDRALRRGLDQLGTLGSGNHFLEVQAVDTVYDARAAQMGLAEGQVTVMIHSGSRGFGYQICDDYLELSERAMATYGIAVPDRQLACAPLKSPEGQAYLGAMRCAANYAWANRQCLMHLARQTFERVFGKSWEALGMHLIYDVAHNIGKFERHQVNGGEQTVFVHRKGATRAFPPRHPETPAAYRELGQPVIIPGDMGRNSFVLVGTETAMAETFGSCCHGAGRVMSRAESVRRASGRSIERELEQQGIIVMGRGRRGVAEEQPSAYKDVNDVVRVVHNAGLAKRVVRLKPLGVIKG